MAGLSVAVVGATGLVGGELLRLLADRDYPIRELRLLASPRSAGRELRFRDQPLRVEALGESSFRGVDHAFFSAGGGTSERFAPAAVAAGAQVIDNSSAFRYRDDVPLVIPEINGGDAAGQPAITANPNCTTIVALMAAAPLHRRFGLVRAVMSSYQAISGAGATVLCDFEAQLRDRSANRPAREPGKRPAPTAFNAIPHIDAFGDNFYTREEMKFLWEGRKILHHPTLRASATCVRIPVLRCHAVALHLEFERPVGRGAALETLRGAPGLVVDDDPARDRYPTPLEYSGRDEVAVGRVRGDPSAPEGRGLALWAVGDQLAKGAALNAIQIGELLRGGAAPPAAP